MSCYCMLFILSCLCYVTLCCVTSCRCISLYFLLHNYSLILQFSPLHSFSYLQPFLVFFSCISTPFSNLLFTLPSSSLRNFFTFWFAHQSSLFLQTVFIPFIPPSYSPSNLPSLPPSLLPSLPSSFPLCLDIVKVAGRAMEKNFTTLGPYVLPLGEQVTYSTVRNSVVQCSVVQCSVVQCSIVQYGLV